MRIQDVEQRLGDFRELVVDLEVYPRGQECERLQHPLHVRVFALVRLQHQSRRHLRILRRELHAHLAQEGQLPFVIQQQVIPHSYLP